MRSRFAACKATGVRRAHLEKIGGIQGASGGWNPKCAQKSFDPSSQHPDPGESERILPKFGPSASIRRGSAPHRCPAEIRVRENMLTKVPTPAFRHLSIPPNAGETHKHVRRGGGVAQCGIHLSMPMPPLILLTQTHMESAFGTVKHRSVASGLKRICGRIPGEYAKIKDLGGFPI